MTHGIARHYYIVIDQSNFANACFCKQQGNATSQST